MLSIFGTGLSVYDVSQSSDPSWSTFGMVDMSISGLSLIVSTMLFVKRCRTFVASDELKVFQDFLTLTLSERAQKKPTLQEDDGDYVHRDKVYIQRKWPARHASRSICMLTVFIFIGLYSLFIYRNKISKQLFVSSIIRLNNVQAEQELDDGAGVINRQHDLEPRQAESRQLPISKQLSISPQTTLNLVAQEYYDAATTEPRYANHVSLLKSLAADSEFDQFVETHKEDRPWLSLYRSALKEDLLELLAFLKKDTKTMIRGSFILPLLNRVWSFGKTIAATLLGPFTRRRRH